MTTLKDIKEHLDNLIGSVMFDYNDTSCGIDPLSHTEFVIWYGDKDITVDSIDAVFDYKFFDGKSLSDIWDDVTELDY